MAMLFLLNDTLVEVPVPEARLQSRWRRMGCGDPTTLMASEAINFVREKVHEIQARREPLEKDQCEDFASLIIATTGANCLILKPTASGELEPRLRDLPRPVLETYKRGVDKGAAKPDNSDRVSQDA